ncbi:hypothetical protein P3S68_021194 [Capsicum galapagoense]
MPFPPPHQPSKAEKVAENKKKWEQAFVPPEEPKTHNQDVSNIDKEGVIAMASLLKKKAKEFRKQKSIGKIDAKEFIAGPNKPSKKKSKSFR